MTRADWILDIDRIVIDGVSGNRLDAAEIRASVTDAVRSSLAGTDLPSRRPVRSTVRFSGVAMAPTSTGVAAAVSDVISSAIGGSGHG